MRDSFEATRPIGFRVDIGAPLSVIGKKELFPLIHHLDRQGKKLKPSLNSFRFADTVFESLGTTVLPIRTSFHVDAMIVEMDVVKEKNIPAILGLDAMDEQSLTLCIMTKTLVKLVVKHGKATDI